MKKKNGFMATSILYSFFLCFIILMMGLLANYAHKALILNKINESIVYSDTDYLYLRIPAFYGYDWDDLTALGVKESDIHVENRTYVIQISKSKITEDTRIHIYGDRYKPYKQTNFKTMFNTVDGVSQDSDNTSDSCKVVFTSSTSYDDFSYITLKNDDSLGDKCSLIDTQVGVLATITYTNAMPDYEKLIGFGETSQDIISVNSDSKEEELLLRYNFKDIYNLISSGEENGSGNDICISDTDKMSFDTENTENTDFTNLNIYGNFGYNDSSGCLETQLKNIPESNFNIDNLCIKTYDNYNYKYGSPSCGDTYMRNVLGPKYPKKDAVENNITYMTDMYDWMGIYKMLSLKVNNLGYLYIYSNIEISEFGNGNGKGLNSTGVDPRKLIISGNEYTFYGYKVEIGNGWNLNFELSFGVENGYENTYFLIGETGAFDSYEINYENNTGFGDFYLNNFQNRDGAVIYAYARENAVSTEDDPEEWIVVCDDSNKCDVGYS